jgi:glyoxylase-like metal-dependent hydrolase (beta-lactamase superfamily II)
VSAAPPTRRRRFARLAIRVGLAVTAVVGAFFAFVGIALYVALDELAPLVDGQAVGPAITVVDGYVATFVLDAGDGQVVLIDAGPDESAAPILAALERSGHDADDVVAVLLTHGHEDHRGGIARFSRARIYAHADELRLLRGEARARGLVPWLSGRAEPLEPDVLVEDGQALRMGSLDIRAFHVPGHTPGNLAWVVNDTLFLGDSAASNEAGEVQASPWIFNDDTPRSETSLASLVERLDAAGVRVDRTVFSHSAPLEGDRALREWVDRRARSR